MISDTVSIPANLFFSLFHSGADTTPDKAQWDSPSSFPVKHQLLTIVQETLQGFSDL